MSPPGKTRRQTPSHASARRTRKASDETPSIAFVFCADVEPVHADVWTKYLTSSPRDTFRHTLYVQSKYPQKMRSRLFRNHVVDRTSRNYRVHAVQNMMYDALEDPMCQWIVVVPETAYPIAPKSALHASLAKMRTSMFELTSDTTTQPWCILTRADADRLRHFSPHIDRHSIEDYILWAFKRHDPAYKYNAMARPFYSRYLNDANVAFNRLTQRDYADIVRAKSLFLSNVTPTFRPAVHVPKQTMRVVHVTPSQRDYATEARLKNTNYTLVAERPLADFAGARHLPLLRDRAYYEIVTRDVDATTDALKRQLEAGREWDRVDE